MSKSTGTGIPVWTELTTDSTDANGQFNVTGLPSGALRFSPVRRIEPGGAGGTANREASLRSALDSADYVLMMQHAVGDIRLTDHQILAADLTGNGGVVSALDGAYLQRRWTDSSFEFPVADATACGSDWAFAAFEDGLPLGATAVNPNITTDTSCSMGAIELPAGAGSAMGLNFDGVLFGDVDGSWGAVTSESLARAAGSRPRLEFGRIQRRGQLLQVRLYVAGIAEFYGANFEISYDPLHFELRHVRKLRPIRGARVEIFEDEVEGRIRVMLGKARPMSAGSILALHLIAKDHDAEPALGLDSIKIVTDDELAAFR